MAGKGAPHGNRYAAKEGEKGFALTLSLTSEDVTFLLRKLRAEGKDTAKLRKYAREWAKNGIYREIKAYMDAEIV